MKKEFFEQPKAMERIETYGFSWIDFLTSVPSVLFVATSYKSNGKPNACLQSWASFAGDEENFYCILSLVSKHGHLYQTVKEKGDLVLNFPSADLYERCMKTIENNDFDDDEITKSGLTAEQALSVNAPRIRECFLNLECRYVWEKELGESGRHAVLCVKVKNVCMDSEYYAEDAKGRYGESGYLYNIHSPINPETGKREADSVAVLKLLKE